MIGTTVVGKKFVNISSVWLQWKISSSVRFFCFLVGSNSWRSTSLVFSPALVDNCVIFAAATDAGCFLCWYRCPLDVIHDSGRYFEMSFSVIPGHVAKYPFLIACSRVCFLMQQRI